MFTLVHYVAGKKAAVKKMNKQEKKEVIDAIRKIISINLVYFKRCYVLEQFVLFLSFFRLYLFWSNDNDVNMDHKEK